MEHIKEIAQNAKEASYALADLHTKKKNEILSAMADALVAQAGSILEKNLADLETAKKNGMTESMQDRLALTEDRIDAMANGLRKVAVLPDPVGEVIGGGTVQSGLKITKKRVPFGVVGMIYEARPNVTADAIGLCLKTGNAVILKGGSDAIQSNIEIVRIMNEAAVTVGLPQGAIGLIADTSREATSYFMTLREYVDVLIPRGGAGLIGAVVQNAKIPVIETGIGNCHVFVDKSADFEMAKRIVLNAKTSRPSVCNAMETLLVHKDLADDFLPEMISALQEAGVSVRGDYAAQRYKDVAPATEEDYYEEFSDLIIAVKTVDDVQCAVSHINTYGTKHSEAIITSSYENAQYFSDKVDAAAVYVNASTRFTDGEEFGFGAEIGISTQKLHARGPMGLSEMTTYKYYVEGEGQTR